MKYAPIGVSGAETRRRSPPMKKALFGMFQITVPPSQKTGSVSGAEEKSPTPMYGRTTTY
jgi:hypothetical protein